MGTRPSRRPSTAKSWFGGLAATVAEWDEDALLLPLGQQSARFSHDATLRAGIGSKWGSECLGGHRRPRHDMEAPEPHYNRAAHPDFRRCLLAERAWRSLPGLLGQADGLAATRATWSISPPLAWIG